MRLIFFFGGIVAAMLGVGTLAVLNLPLPPTEAVLQVPGDEKRGAYLLRLGGCVACHSTAEKPWVGGKPLRSRFGTFYPPNITSDPVAGIGSWTFSQFVRAVRQGVSPSGKPYYPSFPYKSFTDRDMADLWAALRRVPPSATPSRAHELPLPYSIRDGLRLWRIAFEQERLDSPASQRSDDWNVGQYIALGPGHCAACHMPRNFAGGLDVARGMAGDPNMLDGGKSPSLLAQDLINRGWTKDSLVLALQTGVTPSGDALGGSMLEVVQESTRFLMTSNLEDLAEYLLETSD